jgi:hypothetical protein
MFLWFLTMFSLACPIHAAAAAIAELEKIVHANEYRARTSAGHP